MYKKLFVYLVMFTSLTIFAESTQGAEDWVSFKIINETGKTIKIMYEGGTDYALLRNKVVFQRFFPQSFSFLIKYDDSVFLVHPPINGWEAYMPNKMTNVLFLQDGGQTFADAPEDLNVSYFLHNESGIIMVEKIGSGVRLSDK